MPKSPPSTARDTSTPHVLVTGGKSGGHVFPALAVAAELASRGWRASYVGRSESMESRLAEENGIDFYEITAKPLVGTSLAARARSLVTLALSSLAARRLMKRLAPQVVFGTGGFVSAPAVLGARLAGIPVLLLEPNAEVGVANRLLSRFARCAAISFDRAALQLRCPTIKTGVPVRGEFFEITRVEGDSLCVLLLGGSQGSLILNRHLPKALRTAMERQSNPERLRLRVLHQAGRDHVEVTRQAYCEAFSCSSESLEDTLSRKGVGLEILPFIDDVPGAFSRAWVIVSRAGAITLAEICAAGRASVLVPLTLAGGHQAENAAALVKVGAALMVAEDSLEHGALGTALAELLTNPEDLDRMASRARELAVPDARERIADHLESLANGELEVAA